jgi:cell division protein FtsN
MKPKPYNRKKRFFIELSRAQLFLCVAGAIFILSWIFILGIFVGRGYVSDTISRTFTDKIQKLQEEKKALVDKYLVQGKKADIPQEEVLNPQLEFFNKPLQKEPVIAQQITPQPTPKPSPPEAKNILPGKPDSLETKKEPMALIAETKIPKGSQEILVGADGFVVQIGSYREETTAQSSVKRLSEKGYQAHLTVKDIPQKGGKWYRVQIGPFKIKPEAEKIVSKLERDGFRAVVMEKNF